MNGKIDRFCVDLDRNCSKRQFKKIIKLSQERCKLFGNIIRENETEHGYHIKVKLHKPVSFNRSIEIRHLCLDDAQRIVYDVIRHNHGSKMIDTCFDMKVKLK